MNLWRILTLACAAVIYVEAKFYHHQKREATSNICDPSHNNSNKVQCYCIKDHSESEVVRGAECYLTVEGVGPDDQNWNAFKTLQNVNKLTLKNTRGINLKYIPTNAFKYTEALLKLDIKYGNIERIPSFAFANLSFVKEITLGDNQIEVLEKNAFAHQRALTVISLDTNNIIEINRDVFVDLPSIEKLYLTGNKITTLHDRAFVHLSNLKELEIDRNGLFSLNSESFSGLRNLQKLDISSNNLEVIGDNTFLPLNNLKTLNLESNKIQMLDEKAFNGLSKLQYLSLAHNKITSIDNVKIFTALGALISLNLRSNQIQELKSDVMAPILSNFYSTTSGLDIEDNIFPCDCRLEWFIPLMNKTKNDHLKLTIENLKCVPSTELREIVEKSDENNESAEPALVDEQPQVANADYEYYDETQLNGKLFYVDIRHLLNCTNSTHYFIPPKPINEATTLKIAVTVPDTTKVLTTKVTSSPTLVTKNNFKPTTVKSLIVTEYKTTKVTNQGLLDLSIEESTTKSSEDAKIPKVVSNSNVGNEIRIEPKDNSYTTTRLATVSAKPVDHKNDFDHDMASDEARPDIPKAHRSIQEDHSHNFKQNNAQRNGCVTALILMSLCIKILL